MKTTVRENYEAPTIEVVEVKLEAGILQSSYNDSTDGVIPGFGDVNDI